MDSPTFRSPLGSNICDTIPMKLLSDCWLLVILMHPLKKWNQHVQESSYSHLANGSYGYKDKYGWKVAIVTAVFQTLQLKTINSNNWNNGTIMRWIGVLVRYSRCLLDSRMWAKRLKHVETDKPNKQMFTLSQKIPRFWGLNPNYHGASKPFPRIHKSLTKASSE